VRSRLKSPAEQHGEVHFFCKAHDDDDTERIIRWDKVQMMLVDEDYEVTIG
jgi:hypothetical protein